MSTHNQSELERRKQLVLEVFGKTLPDDVITALGPRIDAAVRNARILEAYDREIDLYEPSALYQADPDIITHD